MWFFIINWKQRYYHHRHLTYEKKSIATTCCLNIILFNKCSSSSSLIYSCQKKTKVEFGCSHIFYLLFICDSRRFISSIYVAHLSFFVIVTKIHYQCVCMCVCGLTPASSYGHHHHSFIHSWSLFSSTVKLWNKMIKKNTQNLSFSYMIMMMCACVALVKMNFIHLSIIHTHTGEIQRDCWI